MAISNNRAQDTRRDLLELAAGYAEESVIVTTVDLESPGPEILYVNTAFTKMTGYSAAELIGQTPRLLQGPKTDRRILADLKAAISRGENFIARNTNYRRDGTPFELEWIITHLRDADGNSTHYVAVQRDITGIERAAAGLAEYDEELRTLGARFIATVEELERAERQAAHAHRMSSLGRMARGVSHDLENSLVPIDWMIGLLESDANLDALTKERVASLRSNIDHALSLNRRLADFAGTPNDEPKLAVNVARAIDEVVELTTLQRSVLGPPVLVVVDADDALEIEANPVGFRQVLVNLVMNAIDAMPHGGTISVRAVDEGENALIEVSDSGPGMDRASLDHCFEPFFTTKETGMGLGLSIVHGSVARQGGTIEVSSEAGRGTTFQIRIPIR